MGDVTAADLVGELAEGFLNSRCLHVAANLGVADVVRDEARPLAEVADSLAVDAAALERVMRHLASLGVFRVEAGQVSHNEASRLLRSDDPGGLLPLTRLLAMPVFWDSVKALEDAVRTGRPGMTFVHPDGLFSYLDTQPDESKVYDEGMTAMTVRRIDRTVPHYEFSGFSVIADIGGGRGHLLQAVLDVAPRARGILFDRAQVLKDLPPDDRVTLQPGTFFTDPLPSADCYLLSNIVHDWSDEDALTLLRSLRAAAPDDATLLLFEFVIPEDAAEFEATDIDVSMLALVGGRERTLAEYVSLLEAAGWHFRRTVPTPSQTIIEAGALGT